MTSRAGSQGATISCRLASGSGPAAPPEPSTNTRPCHSAAGSGASDQPAASRSRNPGAPRNSPDSEYAQEWYGQTIAFAVAAEPQGSSSCPRCRHVFANACTTPSGSRASSTPPAPVSAATWEPADGSWQPSATHIQPPPKKCRCSHSNTAGSVYAAGGSIRLSPNGRSASASAPGSTGAGG